MKAVVFTQYGSPEVLNMREISKPKPGKNEVLIKITATTVTRGDVRMRAFDVPRLEWLPARLYLGILRPRRQILGMSIAGTVEAVGNDVTQYTIGDRVFASTFAHNFGGYAEYKCLPEDAMMAKIPECLNDGEAACLPGGGTMAVRFLNKAKLKPGTEILIYGASGAIGTFAVQIAKANGATVTAVCSGRNLDLVRSLGAKNAIDYTTDKWTHSDKQYDCVLDAVGLTIKRKIRSLLKPDGIYLNVHKGHTKERREELEELLRLVAENGIRPYIDRTYPLQDIVEAHRYVDTGRKRGNIVVSVS